eukprot:scaffold3834_cov179-Ochromonas_danica.AAC.9
MTEDRRLEEQAVSVLSNLLSWGRKGCTSLRILGAPETVPQGIVLKRENYVVRLTNTEGPRKWSTQGRGAILQLPHLGALKLTWQNGPEVHQKGEVGRSIKVISADSIVRINPFPSLNEMVAELELAQNTRVTSADNDPWDLRAMKLLILAAFAIHFIQLSCWLDKVVVFAGEIASKNQSAKERNFSNQLF